MKKSNRLSPRQLETLKIINRYTKNGFPPTFSELREELEVTSNETVTEFLEALSKKGFLDRRPKRSRAIMLTLKAKELLNMREEDRNTQLEMPLQFSPVPQFSFSNGVRLVMGDEMNVPDMLSDASTMLRAESTDDISLTAAVEASAWSSFRENTQNILQQTYSMTLLEVHETPYVAASGFTLFSQPSMNVLLWNGTGDNNYFYHGREFGSSKSTTIVENTTGQLTLFPQFTHRGINAGGIIQIFKEKIRKISRWIDYPIYGGALLANFTVLFWSHRTATDPQDLSALLLACSGKFSNFSSYDRVLCRDIRNTNPFINLKIL